MDSLLAEEGPAVSSAPQTPVTLSASVDEQIPREGLSAPPPDSLSTPAETSPPQTTSSHWDTGEVAVQVHRPSKKKKRWEKEPDGMAATPDAASVDESLPESEPEAKRQWKSTGDEASSHVEPAPTPPVDLRPDWMRATETITFAGKEPQAPQAKWSDAEVGVPAAAEAVNSAAVSAVDVLFSPSPETDEVHSHRSLSWSKPRPRLLARLHRVRIGIWSFICSCFSTTRSLTFLAFLIVIAFTVVAAGAVGAVAVMWMVMKQVGAELLSLKFGRAQETEADVKGLQLLHRARIDPTGMVAFFQRLSEQEQGRVEWLSSHPMSAARAERLKQETALLPKTVPEPFTFQWEHVQASNAAGRH